MWSVPGVGEGAIDLVEVEPQPALGAAEADGAEDHGFMYTSSFQDPDGHIWEVFWMDPAALQQ